MELKVYITLEKESKGGGANEGYKKSAYLSHK